MSAPALIGGPYCATCCSPARDVLLVEPQPRRCPEESEAAEQPVRQLDEQEEAGVKLQDRILDAGAFKEETDETEALSDDLELKPEQRSESSENESYEADTSLLTNHEEPATHDGIIAEIENSQTMQAVQVSEQAQEYRRLRNIRADEKLACERREESLRRERDRKAAVAAFLKEHGFAKVGTKKRSLLKTTYPLHVAAQKGYSHVVAMLLDEGADPRKRNSSGKTAQEVAEECNRHGSHAAVLCVLGATAYEHAPDRPLRIRSALCGA